MPNEPDPDDVEAWVADHPEALQRKLPAVVPVRWGEGGPVIGEATVDETGAFAADLSGGPEAEQARAALADRSPVSFGFRGPQKLDWMRSRAPDEIRAEWAPGTRPEPGEGKEPGVDAGNDQREDR